MCTSKSRCLTRRRRKSSPSACRIPQTLQPPPGFKLTSTPALAAGSKPGRGWTSCGTIRATESTLEQEVLPQCTLRWETKASSAMAGKVLFGEGDLDDFLEGSATLRSVAFRSPLPEPDPPRGA